MGHMPYRDWMAAEPAELKAEDALRLEEHLTACPECRAFQAGVAEVDRLLSRPPVISAPPGFVARFQGRMASRESRPRLIFGGAALGFGAAGALVALGVLLAPLVGGLAAVSARPQLTAGVLGGAAQFGRAILAVGGVVGTGLGASLEYLAGQPLAVVGSMACLGLVAVWAYVFRYTGKQVYR